MTPSPTPHRVRRCASSVGTLAAACIAFAAAPAGAAESSLNAVAASCQGGLYGASVYPGEGRCSYGESVAWGGGGAVTSSVSKGWSFVSAESPGTNYGATADAQASVYGFDKWSANSSTGGYMNGQFFSSNSVRGVAQVSLNDQFVLPSQTGWSGPGMLRFSYHVTGLADITWASAGVGPAERNRAFAEVLFQCGWAVVGVGGSACSSPDFVAAPAGSIRSNDYLSFDSSQRLDRVISFDIPVYSDTLMAYGLNTIVSTGLNVQAGSEGMVQVNGGAMMDFSHTFALADVQLFDAMNQRVSGWSIVAGSGFDYANLTPPVPEPSTAALLGLGAALLAGSRVLRRARSA